VIRKSASSITTFRDCQRKWAWKAIAGISSPPNPSASLGLETHDQLENYLTGGSFDFTKESGEIAASGLEHLPKPNTPGMRVEEAFAFTSSSGQTYHGYKDVEILPEDGATPLVIDHKTTSDLGWAKTADDLRKDPQAILYAVDTFRKTGAGQVDLKWIYYQTKRTRKSKLVHLRILPEEALEAFEGIEATAKQMDDIYLTVKDVLELPATTSHCSAYGGCFYQGNCNLSPFDRTKSLMSQGTNGLLAKLNRAKENAAPGVVTVPAPINTTGAAVVPQSVVIAGQAYSVMPDASNPHGQVGPAINPPESALVVTPPVPAPTPAPPDPPRDDPGPKRRGRPPKAVAPPPAVELKALPDPPPAGSKIGTLYVDCGPTDGCADAFVFLMAAKTALLKEGVRDYRLLEFGHGPGRFAIAVAEAVDAFPGHIKQLRVDSTTPEGTVALTSLIERAGRVVR
jgi:hypothetical protein